MDLVCVIFVNSPYDRLTRNPQNCNEINSLFLPKYMTSGCDSIPRFHSFSFSCVSIFYFVNLSVTPSKFYLQVRIVLRKKLVAE